MAHAVSALAPTVLLLPGWQGSGPQHWQARWAERYGDRWVDQDDWLRPRRGDWLARLEDVVTDAPADRPIALVAHSLGCWLVAAWAAFSRQTARVQAALLVAPPDLSQPPLSQALHGWAPGCRQPLPFAAHVLASEDDPYAQADWARDLARDWRARFTPLGARGHLNADSGLGDWPEARVWLEQLPVSETQPW